MSVRSRFGRTILAVLVPVSLVTVTFWLSGLVAGDPADDADATPGDPVPAVEQPGDDDGEKPRAEAVPQPEVELPKAREDFTDRLEVEFRKPFRKVRGRDGVYKVTVRVKNISDEPFEGPLSLAISGTSFEELEIHGAPAITRNGKPAFPVVREGATIPLGPRGKTVAVEFSVGEEDEKSIQEGEIDHTLVRAGMLELAEDAKSTSRMKVAKGRSRGMKNRALPIPSDDPDLLRAQASKREAEEDIMSIPGVIGMATTYDENRDLVYMVTLTKRSAKRRLPETVDGLPVKSELVWSVQFYDDDTPTIYDPNNRGAAVPVRIPQICPPLPVCSTNSNYQSRERPVPVGFEVRNVGSPGVGTYCCLVKDPLTGDHFFMSNDHVLGRNNMAAVGEVVTQPGIVTANNNVATFTRFATITPGNNGNNQVDGAIALVDLNAPTGTSQFALEDVATFITHCDSYGAQGQPIVPAMGHLVAKDGRTTGATTGVIAATDQRVVVGGNEFVQQLRIAPRGGATTPATGAQGDSGSGWVVDDGTNALVGLLFAGPVPNPTGISYANDINVAFSALGVEPVAIPAGCPITPPRP